MIATALIFLLPVQAITQEGNIDTNIPYGIYDVETANFEKGAKWAIQWAVDRNHLETLIPFYGYRLNYDDEHKANVSVSACENINKEREFDLLTALSVGQLEWTPAEYYVGYAGIVWEPTNYEQEKFSAKNLNKNNNIYSLVAYSINDWVPKEIPESNTVTTNTTLGSICGSLESKISGMRKGNQSSLEDNHAATGTAFEQIIQDISFKPAYLVTQNPIPNVDPDRFLWTDPSKYALSTNVKPN